jgi:hypothetical protein
MNSMKIDRLAGFNWYKVVIARKKLKKKRPARTPEERNIGYRMTHSRNISLPE